METGTIVALSIVTLVVFFPAALIWYINVGGVLGAVRGRVAARQPGKAKRELACSVDNDCPPGFICLGGRCVPES